MEKKLTPRQIKAQETKQKLYDKALELFSKNGYCAVTIDDICAKANSSKGAFYFHFSSKHDILVTQVSKTDIEYKNFYENLESGLTGKEKLKAFVEFIIQHISNKGWDIEWVLYVAELAGRHRPRYITNKDRNFYICLERIIKEGQADGTLRNDMSEKEIIEVLTSNIRGMIFNWVISNGEYAITDLTPFMVKFIIAGLENK